MTLSVTTTADAFRVHDGDVELLRYVFVPDSPERESPKPYIDPIRTRAGHVVSLFRPWDHVWHKGIAWSLPVVDDENFWGGPTYVHGDGYVQLPNNGTQSHVSIEQAAAEDDQARFVHALSWSTQSGRAVFAERRSLTVSVLDDDSWALVFETALTNVSDAEVRIGSPTTRGRENAGYGGLFWRGPRSFTEGTLVTADGTGSGDDVRGQRHEWMGFEGRHDVIDAVSLLVIADADQNPQHPPQWFARSAEFAALNPAPFFSEEFVIAPGGSAVFRYAVGVADADASAAAGLADRLRSLL